MRRIVPKKPRGRTIALPERANAEPSAASPEPSALFPKRPAIDRHLCVETVILLTYVFVSASMLATGILMAFRFSGSKAASISAGVLFVVIVFAIFFLVGGDYAFWFFQVLPIKVSRYTETSFPLLWEIQDSSLDLGGCGARDQLPAQGQRRSGSESLASGRNHSLAAPCTKFLNTAPGRASSIRLDNRQLPGLMYRSKLPPL